VLVDGGIAFYAYRSRHMCHDCLSMYAVCSCS
jgi:hypothetical protein